MTSIQDSADHSPKEQRKNWVKFDEEDSTKTDDVSETKEINDNSTAAVLSVETGPHSQEAEFTGAVIDTTQVHVNLDKKRPVTEDVPKPAPRTSVTVTAASNIASRSVSTPVGAAPVPSVRPDTAIRVESPPTRNKPPQRPPAPQRLQNIPLQEIVNGTAPVRRSAVPRQNSAVLRQNFANGDTIVSMLPVNERFPWLIRAKFRPELVPEELMAECLTLTVEEYVGALEVLVNDFRFNCYNMCYKRIMLFWILFGFIILLVLLFSGVRGIGLFGGGVVWLLLNATGIFVCMWLKMKMNHHLEKCLATVNKFFIRHKILLGLDDRGKLSCHKVNLIFVYFDTADCLKKLNEVIDMYDKEPKEAENNNRAARDLQARMDIDDSDIIITGSTNTHVSRKQERAEKLLLRYSQRWVKEYVRHHLDLHVDVHDRGEGGPPTPPRHCIHARCPCQYIEEHLKYKPRGKFCGCSIFKS
uniref:Transmembrane protein 268 n=1 Tax=Strigamia maritima TaxID=126957 RepID=T1JA03_STRMM